MPSAQNSGAGIPGLPGDKDGPAQLPPARTGATASQAAADAAVREQDAAKIPGLPGSESRPAVKPRTGRTG